MKKLAVSLISVLSLSGMISVGAQAGDDTSDKMKDVQGTYAGSFWCDFGEMGMSLSIKDNGKPEDEQMSEAGIHNISGVLNFFPTLVNPDMPSGAFKVSGWIDAGNEYVSQLELKPGEWIQQPEDFGASPMEGRLIGGVIYGKPTVDGCHKLRMQKLAE